MFKIALMIVRQIKGEKMVKVEIFIIQKYSPFTNNDKKISIRPLSALSDGSACSDGDGATFISDVNFRGVKESCDKFFTQIVPHFITFGS